MTEQNKRRLTVDMEKALLLQLKHIALEQETSMRRIVLTLIERFLKEYHAKNK
jgi:hypothetical protein